jgi:ribonuclease J
MHTSGHASTKMLAEVINAVDPQDKIYPMHTECAEDFKDLPIKAELKDRIV